jgi:hypothetical protein
MAAKAKQAGKVVLANFTSGQSYTSRSPVTCAGCDQVIQPGERFTRAKMIGGGAATYPMCRECRAFRENI